MNRLTRIFFLGAVMFTLAQLAWPFMAAAQAVVETATEGVAIDPFPGVSLEQTLALVAVITPIVTWLFKIIADWLKRTLPTWAVAGLATVIGLLLTYWTSLEAQADLAWYIYLLIATAGIGLRQLVKHLVVQPVRAMLPGKPDSMKASLK